MEQKILPVVFSVDTFQGLEAIFEYGAETFSPTMAQTFVSDLIQELDSLGSKYMQQAECRYLPTKSRRYRMYTFVSYLIIYRITATQIEVLNVIHKSRSIATIRAARNIRI
jgi:plasmid stabilization system protein ParE